MLGIVLVLSLGQQYCLSPTGDCDVFAPWRGPRQSRFGWRSPPSGAFFELAPLSGAGMTAACACAAVTGAKGEAVSWTRGSSAYCTRGAVGRSGLATVGIPAGDMTLCSSNLPRVENDGAVLGLLVEDALSGQNIAIQAEDFSNIAWTSTATVTANTTAPPSTNPTSNADTLSDVSGAAIQSSCQTISTTSATQFTASVYVTAGTLAKGSIRLTGTGSSTGDCVFSSTAISGGGAFDRLNCTSPAAYAGTLTAVTVCVEVGTVVGDTGTIIAWGADVKPSSLYLTSYVPTTTVAVTRSADVPTVTLYSALPTTDGSAAASFTPEWSTSVGAPLFYLMSYSGSAEMLYGQGAVGDIRTYDSTTQVIQTTTYTANVTKRLWSSYTGSAMQVSDTTATASGAFDGSMLTATSLQLGQQGGSFQNNAILSRVCLDPSPTRCR